MSEKNQGFLPGSSQHCEIIANSIADDDNIDGPLNDIMAGYYYFKAAKLGKQGK